MEGFLAVLAVCHGIADFLSVSVLAPRGIGTGRLQRAIGALGWRFSWRRLQAWCSTSSILVRRPMVLSALVAIILGAAAWLARGWIGLGGLAAAEGRQPLYAAQRRSRR